MESLHFPSEWPWYQLPKQSKQSPCTYPILLVKEAQKLKVVSLLLFWILADTLIRNWVFINRLFLHCKHSYQPHFDSHFTLLIALIWNLFWLKCFRIHNHMQIRMRPSNLNFVACVWFYVKHFKIYFREIKRRKHGE